MRSMCYVRSGVLLAMTMLCAQGTFAEKVCYHIDAVQNCPTVNPSQSECDWGNGWTKDGPYFEVYVSQKTALAQGSGSYCITRKCRRYYIMSKPGFPDEYCYGGSYGVNYSFVDTPCTAGGSGT